MAEDRRGEKIIISENGSETADAMEGAYAGVDMREIYEKKPVLYKMIKRLFDIFGSAAAMVILSPVFIVTSIAVKACDGGPAFYSGMRYGKDMKIFPMHKFRSMCVNAESKTEKYLRAGDINGLAFKIKNDPRVTTVGRFIRRTSIDELPQLWNVLIGDMAFIGPRPERPNYIRQIMEIDPRYEQLYKIRPGVTSYATLYNGYTDTMEKMLRRLELDLYYLEHRSLRMDFQILFKTFTSIVFGKKF